MDLIGVEPITPILQGSVAPIGMQAHLFERSVRGLNPVSVLTTDVCGHNTYSPLFGVIPGRIELPISWVSSRRLRHWTTGSCCQ